MCILNMKTEGSTLVVIILVDISTGRGLMSCRIWDPRSTAILWLQDIVPVPAAS